MISTQNNIPTRTKLKCYNDKILKPPKVLTINLISIFVNVKITFNL